MDTLQVRSIRGSSSSHPASLEAWNQRAVVPLPCRYDLLQSRSKSASKSLSDPGSYLESTVLRSSCAGRQAGFGRTETLQLKILIEENSNEESRTLPACFFVGLKYFRSQPTTTEAAIFI